MPLFRQARTSTHEPHRNGRRPASPQQLRPRRLRARAVRQRFVRGIVGERDSRTFDSSQRLGGNAFKRVQLHRSPDAHCHQQQGSHDRSAQRHADVTRRTLDAARLLSGTGSTTEATALFACEFAMPSPAPTSEVDTNSSGVTPCGSSDSAMLQTPAMTSP